MLQFQYMAPWIPSFNQTIESELNATGNKPPFTSFQFATVDSNGFPHNRTLIFRGFLFNDKSNNIITFTTDKRMEKYQELINNDKFEAVFYFGRMKKQFRFRGRARIIDDTYRPTIDLSSIQPKNLIENMSNSSSSDEDEGEELDEDEKEKEEEKEEEEEEEEEEQHLSMKVSSSSSGSSSFRDSMSPFLNINNEINQSCQSVSISYPIISPTLASKIQQDTSSLNISYTNLHDMSNLEYLPPSTYEWDQELKRQWYTLLKNLRSSFRKPSPKTRLNNENQKIIDKISRGVDGNKEEAGFKNFSIVGLFIDYVDLVELDKDRRYIYKKDAQSHLWSEEEVCP